MLDGGAVFGQRKVEGGAAAATLLRVGDRFSGGVVVVAEVFSAQAGAAAAVAVGEDVAALVLFGGWCGVLHGWSLSRETCAKSSKEKTCVRTSRCRSGLNAKARLGGRAFSFSYYFYFNGLRETKMPNLADLFLACKGFGLFVFPVLILDFWRLRGLTCDFWAENDEK